MRITPSSYSIVNCGCPEQPRLSTEEDKERGGQFVSRVMDRPPRLRNDRYEAYFKKFAFTHRAKCWHWRKNYWGGGGIKESIEVNSEAGQQCHGHSGGRFNVDLAWDP
jgi:hypothetical protein